MSEPEIARRCQSCGASIRVRGLFCPQCGKPMPEQKADNANIGTTAPAELPGAETTKLEAEHPESAAPAEDVPVNQTAEGITAAPVTTTHSSAAPRQPAMRAARGTVDRARAARQDVSQGVGKLREISSVVLDEASDDPSLRFVLVAAGLFLLFLVILLLSELAT